MKYEDLKNLDVATLSPKQKAEIITLLYDHNRWRFKNKEADILLIFKLIMSYEDNITRKFLLFYLVDMLGDDAFNIPAVAEEFKSVYKIINPTRAELNGEFNPKREDVDVDLYDAFNPTHEEGVEQFSVTIGGKPFWRIWLIDLLSYKGGKLPYEGTSQYYEIKDQLEDLAHEAKMYSTYGRHKVGDTYIGFDAINFYGDDAPDYTPAIHKWKALLEMVGFECSEPYLEDSSLNEEVAREMLQE
jgi:hypothetical protein